MTKFGLILSLTFHLILLLGIFSQITFKRSPLTIAPKAIPLRVIPIKDKTQLSLPKTSKDTPKKAAKQLPHPPIVEKPQSAPVVENKEQNMPPPTKKVLPKKEQKTVKKTPKTPQKQLKNTQKVGKKDEKMDKKPKKPIQEDAFLSVMKAVEMLPSQPQSTEVEKDPTPENENPTLDEILSLSELDALRQQLSSCWRLPAGARGAENLIIHLTVTMNPDQTVQKVSLTNNGQEQALPYFQIAYESAKRALYHPNCTPLKLPKEKYAQWQTFTISFNPKEMII